MTSHDDDNKPTEQSPSSGEPPATQDLAKRDADLTEREAAVATREAELATKAKKLRQDEDKLSAREQVLAQKSQNLSDLDKALIKRQRDVITAEGDVERRVRAVTQREMEADAGFASKSREAMAELTKSHSALRAKLEEVQRQLETERLQGIEKLEKWIAQERAARLGALDSEIAARRQRAERDEQEALERERARMKRERQEHEASLAQERDRLTAEKTAFQKELEQSRAALDTRERELRRDQNKVQWREEALDTRRAEIERAADERARDRVASLERQLEQLRGDYHRVVDQRTLLERQLDSHQQLHERFNGSPEEVLRRLDDARKNIGELEQELLSRPSASDKEKLIELQEQHRSWSDERQRLLVEIGQLKAERSRWHVGVHALEEQRDRREIAERRFEVLKGEMEKYANEVERLKSIYVPSEERDARVGAIEAPWRTDLQRASEDKQLTELSWLNRIVEACEGSGMRFPKRLIQAFHTSLKASELSPLTVLAGVSGTGKSELPRLYARFGGIAFLSLPVQPNWDSPQSLFGFFNSVDNRFNATSVLRAMVQSQYAQGHEKYQHGFADRLLLVLLDEMNLAHVEQYFSDLLSRLEQRRGETKDITLDIDLGAGMPAYPLRLGRNVMWVGTMNEDETTRSLSDKVVDRSNLLYFPRPRTLHSRADITLADEQPLLPEATWRGWIKTRSPFEPSEVEPFRVALQEINSHLEHVGRALGHRVWQSVEYYLANHPEALEARVQGDPEALRRAMRRAFEDQLVLKVMPKLRGIETSGEAKRRCLDPIRKQLDDSRLGHGLVEDFDIACRVGYGAFIWNSARYLENVE
jgi:hypothetical protein